MTYVDHLFLLALAVAQPIRGAIAFRKYVAEVRAGCPPNRAKLYRDVHLLEWSSLTVLATTWIVLGRPAAELGLRAGAGPGLLVAAAIVIAVSLFLAVSLRSARRATGDKRREFADSLGTLRHFAPHTPGDLRRFIGVSITAGIVEEIVYRGFLFWYLLHVMPVWAALIVASLIFGLGHSYQGVGGMLRVTGAGLAVGGLYLLSGSLWLPIVAHALLDIQQGLLVQEMLGGRPASNAAVPLVPQDG